LWKVKKKSVRGLEALRWVGGGGGKRAESAGRDGRHKEPEMARARERKRSKGQGKGANGIKRV